MSGHGQQAERRALRRALLDRHPWLDHAEAGPRAVEAGECDRCGAEPRMVQPCGPPPAVGAAGRLGPDWALGRACAAEVGVAGWCDGHEDAARAVLRFLAALPPEADDVARWWWVATGEVRVGQVDVRGVHASLEAGQDAPGDALRDELESPGRRPAGGARNGGRP